MQFIIFNGKTELFALQYGSGTVTLRYDLRSVQIVQYNNYIRMLQHAYVYILPEPTFASPAPPLPEPTFDFHTFGLYAQNLLNER